MKFDYVESAGRPRCLCRWWLRSRPVGRAVQLSVDGTPAVLELYVPLWAWPFELIHRAVFGRARLQSLE